ncbi:uncharacterized protein METZ01_LOCUS186959 [marine metagenome]|uniref:Uncharacterized protein n=1 Tax=marine metagenome TaxID=408172 RepID=A0A382D781_9ZZZZ
MLVGIDQRQGLDVLEEVGRHVVLPRVV